MEKKLNIEISNPADLPGAAKSLLEMDTGNRIFLFEGQMGSGKTTLIKQMCRLLGSTDNFSSPTFSIVNEYSCPKGKIFHLDLYRLKSKEELLDIGIEDYLVAENFCFIEWPALTKDMIDSAYIEVSLSVDSNNIRYISAAKILPG